MIHRREFEALLVCTAGVVLPRCLFSPLVQPDPVDGWKQWGGPDRNFIVGKRRALIRLPKPTLAWKRNLGSGHSAPVCDQKHVYSVHLEGDHEVLSRWHLKNGQSDWKHRCKIGFHASTSEYDGPHATPTIVGDRILVANIDGQIRAINRSTGKQIWVNDLKNSFGTMLPQAGYASSPVVWKDHVIVPTLGDAESAETEYYKPTANESRDQSVPGAVALNLNTGKEIWRTSTFRSSHGSPILAEVRGQPMVVFHGMFELIAVNPHNGQVLFRQLLRTVAADNVSFTPIWDARRNQFLIAHGYCDHGAQAIRLKKVGDRWQTEIAWTNSKLQTVHTNGVVFRDLLIGTRRSPATLMIGIDVRDGSTKFRQRGYGKSNIVVVGEQLLILDESGELISAELSEKGVKEIWKIAAMKRTAWTAPSLCQDHLIMRDSRQLKVYRF